MCGRFTQKFTWQELVELYRITQTPVNLRPNYNVCPTDPASVIIPGELNYLLNPAHADFPKLRISKPTPFAFDLRLLS